MDINEAKELLENNGYLVESKMSLIRGGKPTNTFKIMEFIIKHGGKARTMEIAHALLHSNGQNAITILRDKNSEFFNQDQKAWGKPSYWSLTPLAEEEYKRAKRELGITDEPKQKPEPISNDKTTGIKVMPFEECFFATLILDAEDYSGGRECSWISPSDLKEVLSVYCDEENEEPLSNNMQMLREKYERLAEKVKTGVLPNAVSKLGFDYDEISKNCVPGLTHLYETWPENGRGARTQKETSLWMCVAPSRNAVEFDSNEWNSRPVKK